MAPYDASRPDLVPRPDARVTSDFDESLAIVGRHGAGLLFLHGSRLRVVSGFDWRRCAEDGRFEPHPNSRNLLSGRRTIPWMHHPFAPHVLVPGEDDRADLYVICGTFGPRHQWGDGVEANYPQYGILKCHKDRAGKIWEDGVALEIAATAHTVEGRRVEETFRRSAWRFRHEPGRIAFLAVDPEAMLRSVTLLITPSRPAELRIHVEVARPPGLPATVEVSAAARFLLATVVPPEPAFEKVIDVLDAPFGYGKFFDLFLQPVREPDAGVRFENCQGWQTVSPYLRCGERPASILIGAADRRAEEIAALHECLDSGEEYAMAFDARVVAKRKGRATRSPFEVDFFLGADLGEPAPPPPPLDVALAEVAERFDGPRVLKVATGDRYVDGYARFALATARSLLWPNGVVATGALGYGGMGHVGQDVPFFYPVLLYADDPEFRRAAERNLDFVFESPSRGSGAGILDHPCDGLDFSFQPFDPRRARVWKRRGAAGFFRQISSLARYWAFTADDERVRRHFAVAFEKLRAHYLPYAPDAAAWSEGEETQDRLYAHLAAPPALEALASMAEAFGAPDDAAVCRAARDAVVATIHSPLEDGGFVVTRDVTSAEGEVYPKGLLANPRSLTRGGKWHTFDAPLVNGVALLSGVLEEPLRKSIASHFADLEASPWFVAGAGFAKRHGGEWGVWHWHNAVLAHGLFLSGEPDSAFELLRLMGRGVADINGIGCPGEETNGGSYAMAIGCLGLVALVEGLFGIRPTRDGLVTSPALPAALRSARLESLAFRGERIAVEVERRGAGVATPAEVCVTVAKRP